jgi:hypothetical protein
LGIRVVNVVVLSLVCGCTPPAKKATLAGTGRPHHHTTAHANSHPHHELSDAEKDKLFQDFQRWRAAKGQIEPQALLPLVEADQPLDTH